MRFSSHFYYSLLFLILTIFSATAQDSTDTRIDTGPITGAAFSGILNTNNVNTAADAKAMESFIFWRVNEKIEIGPVVTLSIGPDSLNYSSLGISFNYSFNKNLFGAITPAFASLDVNNTAANWFNFTADIGYKFAHDHAFIKAGLLTVDGEPYLKFTIGGM